MAKAKPKPKVKRRAPHVRVLCPHCGKTVTVTQPTRYQLTLPCPVCRVPIGAHIIESAMAAQQPVEASAEGVADEPAPADEGIVTDADAAPLSGNTTNA